MEVYFGDKQTARLYEGGSPGKADPPPEVVDAMREVIELMLKATSTQDLRNQSSLRYEHLKADRKGWVSVRVNRQYRLIFEEAKGQPAALVNVRLSKHYE